MCCCDDWCVRTHTKTRPHTLSNAQTQNFRAAAYVHHHPYHECNPSPRFVREGALKGHLTESRALQRFSGNLRMLNNSEKTYNILPCFHICKELPHMQGCTDAHLQYRPACADVYIYALLVVCVFLVFCILVTWWLFCISCFVPVTCCFQIAIECCIHVYDVEHVIYCCFAMYVKSFCAATTLRHLVIWNTLLCIDCIHPTRWL